jgi:hypothetical protein
MIPTITLSKGTLIKYNMTKYLNSKTESLSVEISKSIITNPVWQFLTDYIGGTVWWAVWNSATSSVVIDVECFVRNSVTDYFSNVETEANAYFRRDSF